MVNDYFYEALPLSDTPGKSSSIDTRAATAEPDEPAHVNEEATHSVWWQYTPSVDGELELDTFDSDFFTTIGVYTGRVISALAEVAFK